METEPERSVYDVELDVPRRRRPSMPIELVAYYQRLLVNPLLAILGWWAGLALIRYALRSRNLPLFLSAVLWLLLPFFLFRFHCLDCHTSDWCLRARQHVCPGVIERWLGRKDQALKIRVRTQLLGWIYLSALSVVVFWILFGFRR